MNKKIMKLAITALACVTICGTAMAAPGRGKKPPAPARQHHQPPAPKRTQHHGGPVHHHAPAPRPHHTPPPHHTVHHYECHEEVGWTVLGAAVIGGVIGARAN